MYNVHLSFEIEIQVIFPSILETSFKSLVNFIFL